MITGESESSILEQAPTLHLPSSERGGRERTLGSSSAACSYPKGVRGLNGWGER